MKKNWMRVISIIAAMGLMITACGREMGKDTQTEQNDSSDSNTSFDTLVNELKNDIYLYGYEEPIDIRLGLTMSPDFEWIGGESLYDNIWNDLYTEMGYNAEILYAVDETQAATKLATSITTGKYSDIIGGSATEIVKYAEAGVIADITDVFEEYASDELKEYVQYGGINHSVAGSINGRMYGIPVISEYQTEGMQMFIRQDWLDELGLEIPSTMEELKAVSRAFTENDPDGNGKDDTYGLALCGKEGFTFWSGLQAFFEGYGAAPGYWSDSFTFVERDGEIIWGGLLADEMKAALRDLQEMYENGWLTNDFGLMDYNQLLKDVGDGKCGIYFAPRWGGIFPYAEALKSNPEAEISAALIPDGMGEGSSKAYIQTTPEKFYAVSSKCEHPEALIKLMNLTVRLLANYQNMEEYYMFWGQSGVYSGWKASWIPIQKPGNIMDTITKELEAMETGELPEGLTMAQAEEIKAIWYFYEMREEGRLAELLAAEDARILHGIYNSTVCGENGGGVVMLQQIQEDKFMYSAYNTVPTEKMASCYTTLNTLTIETIIKIICGADVESYDDFIETWKNLGGEEVSREASEWYEQNVKNTK